MRITGEKDLTSTGQLCQSGMAEQGEGRCLAPGHRFVSEYLKDDSPQ